MAHSLEEILTESLIRRFWAKIKKLPNGCWEWTAAKAEFGYGVIGKGSREKGIIRATHVSWMIHKHEVVPKGLNCCHKCDNPSCVNPDHLFIGTHRANAEDMIAKGRNSLPPILKGELNGFSKLSIMDVRRIKRLASGKIRHWEIAKLIGVSRPCITAVLNYRNWAHEK